VQSKKCFSIIISFCRACRFDGADGVYCMNWEEKETSDRDIILFSSDDQYWELDLSHVMDFLFFIMRIGRMASSRTSLLTSTCIMPFSLTFRVLCKSLQSSPSIPHGRNIFRGPAEIFFATTSYPRRGLLSLPRYRSLSAQSLPRHPKSLSPRECFSARGNRASAWSVFHAEVTHTSPVVHITDALMMSSPGFTFNRRCN
jgi:hypothetical protein